MTYARIAVIRLRGLADVSPDVEDTLNLLRLRRRYVMVVIDERPSYLGMLQKVKDWVTWGEISADTLAEVLRARGRLVGDRPIDLNYMRSIGWDSFEDFALAYIMGEVQHLACPKGKRPRSNGRLLCIPGLKPFFRLHPPRGGLKSIKKPFSVGGDLGYRGPLINELILRML